MELFEVKKKNQMENETMLDRLRVVTSVHRIDVVVYFSNSLGYIRSVK